MYSQNLDETNYAEKASNKSANNSSRRQSKLETTSPGQSAFGAAAGVRLDSDGPDYSVGIVAHGQ